MIILSGLLVIAAIALLVAGIVTEEQGVLGLTGLQLIYVSIAVSIVSALCLAIGVLIRRKELFGTAPARPAAPRSRPAGRAARKAAKAAKASEKAEDAASAPDAEEDAPRVFPAPAAEVPDDALVHVIPGRKRYHLDTCRQLAGRQIEELTYIEAREEGFSPCTACLPDTALAARASAAAAAGGDRADGPDAESGQEETRDFGAPGSFASAGPVEAPDEPAEPAEPSAWERHGAHRAPEWSAQPSPSDPPAADTITDWDPKALTADPVDPLDPAYPLPEDAHSGPSPLEPRRGEDSWPSPSGDSWSSPSGDSWSSAAQADPFPADGLDSTPTPDQGTPLPGSSLDLPEEGSAPSEPARPAEAPQAPEPERPLSAPAPQSGAPAEESYTGPVPEVPGSREPEEAEEAPVVRILSGTKRYHRPDCALIEDIGEEDEDLETITRDTAEERGCTPCLVCQPDKEPAV